MDALLLPDVFSDKEQVKQQIKILSEALSEFEDRLNYLIWEDCPDNDDPYFVWKNYMDAVDRTQKYIATIQDKLTLRLAINLSTIKI